MMRHVGSAAGRCVFSLPRRPVVPFARPITVVHHVSREVVPMAKDDDFIPLEDDGGSSGDDDLLSGAIPIDQLEEVEDLEEVSDSPKPPPPPSAGSASEIEAIDLADDDDEDDSANREIRTFGKEKKEEDDSRWKRQPDPNGVGGIRCKTFVAKLRLDAVPEDLDFRKARGLDRFLVLRLLGCEWIRQGQSLLITGATGSGKSYLACALGHQACRHGLPVRYFRLSRLLGDLTLARVDGSYTKPLQRLARAHLLILADWGLAALDDRYGRRATVVTSQIPVKHWHEIVGDATFDDAILDRLVHNAHRIPLKGGSMRRVYDSTKTAAKSAN